ncbi:MAG: FHA domain-containing protein [Acidimicrobiia bacterium]|nr:FHA domain-containing protein [Acidimicrobiia bacterium]
MNLARGLERRLENLVDGASATVFKGRMHPVVIGSKVLRQLDFLVSDSVAGPQIPNDLVVALNPSDIDPDYDRRVLIRELEAVVRESAKENGWRLAGPVSIHVKTDPGIPRGVLGCTGTVTAGPLPAWSQLIADDGSAVLNIAMNRVLIGRGLDCDIRIANEQVSRHHAIIFLDQGSTKLSDLGSSNGTFVNHSRIAGDPLVLRPGDNVLLGDLSFTYRPVN